MIFTVIAKSIGGYNGLKKRYDTCRSKMLKKLLEFLHKGYQFENGAYIPLQTITQYDISFMHGIHGVFISGDAEIGSKCIIYHHVTIGSNRIKGSKSFGSPKIGDNCLIGVGAKIVGGITIGNNCRIGAGCVITTNIPENSIVVSPKPVVISKNKLDNDLI